jgi:DNA-binding XRE family transcriptional regulator
MNIRNSLAVNVLKLREAPEWSQEELADPAEVDRSDISSIERRKYAVSIEMVDRLASAQHRSGGFSSARRRPGMRKGRVTEAVDDEHAGSWAVRLEREEVELGLRMLRHPPPAPPEVPGGALR